MNIPNDAALAAWKISSMCATVPFSVTLAPVAAQLIPVGLSTSFCGSMNTTAVSRRFQFIGVPLSCRRVDRACRVDSIDDVANGRRCRQCSYPLGLPGDTHWHHLLAVRGDGEPATCPLRMALRDELSRRYGIPPLCV